MAGEKSLTIEEVAAHDQEEDCYIIIGNKGNGGPKVYDVTKYLEDHPGGSEVICELAGKYADDMFEDIGHSNEARKQLKEFLVGPLKVGVLVAVVAVGVGYYFYSLQ